MYCNKSPSMMKLVALAMCMVHCGLLRFNIHLLEKVVYNRTSPVRFLAVECEHGSRAVYELDKVECSKT